jgi:heterodisulfide reductase subunit A1
MTGLRIGVFICHCGANVVGAIDIGRLKAAISSGGLACIEDYPYLCSVGGQELIKGRIKSSGLEGVVIAACSPGQHEHTFRECIAEAGLNRYMLDIANIREQCAWAVGDEDPTARAIDLVRSSVNAIKLAKPRQTIRMPVKKSIVVVGGGISGISATLSLSRMGIKVYLVEKSPTLGGNMVKIGKVFSPDKLTEECAMCSLAPMLGEVSRDKNVEVITLAKVTGMQGHAGNLKVRISIGPVLVDGLKCTSCGQCQPLCPVRVQDEWNAGLSSRRAIYRPFPQAMPSTFTIDADACRKCGNCVDACGPGAIDLNATAFERTIEAGAIVLATGHRELDPTKKYEFGYGKYPEVITQMELARILAINGPTLGRLEIPQSKKTPKRVVMVQCVGSRDKKPGSIPYCSTICCMTALKHAHYIREHFPGTEVYICYTDMRTPGPYENYYLEVQKKEVKFLRGRVAHVITDKDGILIVRVEDTLGNRPVEIESDMVVLSCALEPSFGTIEAANALGISLTPEFFVQEKHPKLEPTQTMSPCVFVCGTAQGAKDITASINQARSAASRAAELVLPGFAEAEPKFAVVDPDKCTGCGECLRLCSTGAIRMDGRVEIDPLSCTGTGECISACPAGAISLPGSSDEEIYARIDGCLASGSGKILAFLDEKIAYVAADNAGVNRVAYPPEARIIAVPSVMRLELKHLLYAFEKGASGIFLGDGTANASGIGHDRIRKQGEKLRKDAAAAGIDSKRITYYEAYLPHYKGLAQRLEQFFVALNAK